MDTANDTVAQESFALQTLLSSAGMDVDSLDFLDHPNRPAWLQGRRAGIGASESAALFDVAKDDWVSPRSIYEDKAHDIRTDRQLEVLDWGLLLESAIAQGYSNRFHVELINLGAHTIVRRKEFPLAQATPDFIIPHMPGKDGPGTCQIKNSDAHIIGEFRGGLPLHLQVQGQHELFATGLKWGVFPVLFGGNKMQVFDIEADASFQQALTDRIDTYWADHVMTGIAPEVDGSKATTDALKSKWGTVDEDSVVLLPSRLAEDYRVRMRLKLQAGVLDKEIRVIENRFREAMKDKHIGLIPEVGKLSYPLIVKDERVQTVKASSYRQFFFPRSANPEKAAKLIAKHLKSVPTD